MHPWSGAVGAVVVCAAITSHPELRRCDLQTEAEDVGMGSIGLLCSQRLSRARIHGFSNTLPLFASKAGEHGRF
jgi:hypothetical protein